MRNTLAKENSSAFASQELIEEYQEFVRRIVGTMIQSMGLPSQLFDEFVSAGYLGLVEAASRFESEDGRDFKAFAFLRVRGAVIDSIRECADTSGKAYRYVKALQAVQSLREEPESEELPEGSREEVLAEVLDFAAKGILAFRLSAQDVEEEIVRELGSPVTPEECLEKKRQSAELNAALATLTEKERLVIAGFYFQDLSFTEIADEIHGLSKSWASRLHSKAIEKLKNRLIPQSEE